MEVVIPKSEFDKHTSCGAHLKSPEWDEERQAIVYSDWETTVERLMSTREGVSYLSWLIGKKLVPMSEEEFRAARKARGLTRSLRSSK